MIHTKESIKEAMLTEMALFTGPFQPNIHPEQWLVTASEDGKWTPLQHLDHLVVSVQAVNKALRWTPLWVVRWRFGKPNRPGRSYDALVTRYKEKLKESNPTNNPFSNGLVDLSQKAALLSAFDRDHQRFIHIFSKWSEADLDAYLVPHPLLGKLTLRELLFFMTYHIEHHRRA